MFISSHNNSNVWRYFHCSGERHFPCPLCMAKFPLEHHLLRHLNAHGADAVTKYKQQRAQEEGGKQLVEGAKQPVDGVKQQVEVAKQQVEGAKQQEDGVTSDADVTTDATADGNTIIIITKKTVAI